MHSPFFKKESGFTLVETLVTATIFGVLVTIVGSAFVSMLNIQRRAFNTQQIEENASYVLEYMAKELRVSQILTEDTPDCPATPATILHITNQEGEDVIYQLVNGAVHRVINGADTTVSSNTVVFDAFTFCVDGQALGDTKQPRVSLMAMLHSAQSNQQTSLSIQTTLSQRFLND